MEYTKEYIQEQIKSINQNINDDIYDDESAVPDLQEFIKIAQSLIEENDKLKLKIG